MREINPYASPQHASGSLRGLNDSTRGVWQDVDELVIRKDDAVLPDRCIACNAPAHGGRLRRRLLWYHPAIGLLAPLLFVVAILFFKQMATVEFGVCRRHLRKRRSGLFALACAVGAIIGGIFVLPSKPDLFLPLAIVVITAVVYAALQRLFRVRHIDAGYVRLQGVHPDYLKLLPWFPQHGEPAEYE